MPMFIKLGGLPGQSQDDGRRGKGYCDLIGLSVGCTYDWKPDKQGTAESSCFQGYGFVMRLNPMWPALLDGCIRQHFFKECFIETDVGKDELTFKAQLHNARLVNYQIQYDAEGRGTMMGTLLCTKHNIEAPKGQDKNGKPEKADVKKEFDFTTPTYEPGKECAK